MAELWPVELRLSQAGSNLAVVFDNGEVVTLAAERLRTDSPSAEVQGHNGVGGQIVTGKQHVRIVQIEPVGNYAVRLIFDDGHDSGLFTWDYLYKLGRSA